MIRLRNRAALTQEKLAEKIGIRTRSLQSIEAGARGPTIGVLNRLRNSLKCERQELFSHLH